MLFPAVSRQAAAHTLQASAQFLQATLSSEYLSHSAAQASHISAQTRHNCSKKVDCCASNFIHKLHISVQSLQTLQQLRFFPVEIHSVMHCSAASQQSRHFSIQAKCFFLSNSLKYVIC